MESNAPNLKPYDGKLLVRPTEAPEFSEGAHGSRIALPDAYRSEKKKATTGTVLAIGPRRKLRDGDYATESRVAIGDLILFASYSGVETELAGVRYLVLVEDEVLGVLEPEPAAVA